jgi:cyanophycinase-like exopeptidase
LYWLSGRGWLVLSGGGDWRQGETDNIDAHVLGLANLDRPMVALFSEGAPENAEEIIEHYVLLGGPTGEAFSLPAMTRQDLSDSHFTALLEQAGILYLGGENPVQLVHSLRNTQALKYIVRGFATMQGLILVGAGGGAAALGTWLARSRHGEIARGFSRGFGFLRNAVVAPHFTQTEEAPRLHDLLSAHPNQLGLGIPEGTALALGPEGEVQTWGEGKVTAVVHTDENHV